MGIKAEMQEEARVVTVRVRGLLWGIRTVESIEFTWGRTFAGWDLEQADLQVTDAQDPKSWAVVHRFTAQDFANGVVPAHLVEIERTFRPEPAGLDGLFRVVEV